MTNNLILILAHQDDEIFIFNRIHHHKNKKKIFIFYMTSGLDENLKKDEINHRNIESLKVLLKMGVSKRNIRFIGGKLSIKVNTLYKSMEKVFNELSKEVNKIRGPKVIITHALEGGHEDHDACYYLTKKLSFKKKDVLKIYQFPAYHGKNLPFIFYKVQSPLKENGLINSKKIGLLSRFKFIYLLFIYVSQIKVWIGLYPFIILNFLLKRNDKLQEVPKNILIRKPHLGKLLYEKRGFCKYLVFKKYVKKFL